MFDFESPKKSQDDSESLPIFQQEDSEILMPEYKIFPPYHTPLEEEVFRFGEKGLTDFTSEIEGSLDRLFLDDSSASQKDIEPKKDEKEVSQISQISLLNYYCTCHVDSNQILDPRLSFELEGMDYLIASFKMLEPGKRWGLVQDKALFKIIFILESQGKISLEQLTKLDPDKARRDKGLRHLHQLIGWKSSFKDLAKRIKKRINNDFSQREVKYLKKILNYWYRYENIDYLQILWEFPGKTLERVRQASDLICEARLKRKLMEANPNEIK